MFYFLISKLPLIFRDDDGKNKFFKIFLIGTIFYIILHAFLYSSYSASIDFIQKYRSYIYYIWGSDLAFTGIMTTFMTEKYKDLTDEPENVKNNAESESDYESSESTMNRPTMTKEEIDRRLSSMKTQSINDDPPVQSPFIKNNQEISDTNISLYEIPEKV